jgi:arylsulfatase A-like enzyme/Tfp pilus assembly protein PilF
MKSHRVGPARNGRKHNRTAIPPARTAGSSRTLRYGGVALVGAVVLAAVLVPGLRQPARPPNLLLVTLDTVRADRIGAYGYQAARTPALDRLSGAGVRFADATAPAPITGPSHAALLTGMYPGRLGVRDNVTTPLPDDAVTLAETLSARGYQTGGFVGAFLLDRPYGFAQGFQVFESGFTRVESGSEANAERRGDAVTDDALRWIASLSAEQPFFAWVHLYDAHVRYEPPEPLATAFADRPYDGEIAFVDQQIDRLADALNARGALDGTYVIAIADHGEALGEHGEDEHGVFLYDEVMRIPWLMRGPGLPQGLVVGRQVRAVDLFPTVLDLLQIEVPSTLDGHSVLPLIDGGGPGEDPPAYAETHYPRLHYGWSELRSLRADGWKVIDAPRPELYDLKTDPGEQRNVYETQRALADKMIAETQRIWRALGGERAVDARQPDPETLQRLRSLGYVGVSAPPAASGTGGADPKDKVAERREFNRLISEAIDDLRARRPDAAAGKLRRLVELNARAYDLHLLLGRAYEQQGKWTEALGEYEMAALLNPYTAAPFLSAAEIDLARQNTASARRRVEEARRLEPQSYDVALVTGRVLEQETRLSDALAAYERAARLNPANVRPRTLIVGLATRMGDHDRAEAQLRELLAMNYQPSRTHFALGRIAELRGRPDEAVRQYREALRLEPGLAMAQEGLRRLDRR